MNGPVTPSSLPLEEYAFLGDRHGAALVSRGGSIDWLCLPRFDSPACFAALLGDESNGHWTIAPASGQVRTERRYTTGLVLETDHHTPDGAIRVTDALATGHERRLLRRVEGRSGRVPVRMQLRIRFDYGSIVPWVRHTDGQLRAVGGPDSLVLRTPVPTRGEGFSTVAEFELGPGDVVPFELAWAPSHEPVPAPIDVEACLAATVDDWSRWSERSTYDGRWRQDVRASLAVLRALVYEPTGGIVAAPTTSLPEELGGGRNWDYRYGWLRDATFALLALLQGGYVEEARSWREWLVRAVAGDPSRVQIMYGVAGERRVPEQELGWLAGYGASRPVRIGNAAVDQLQLDVPGEVIDALYWARRHGIEVDDDAWALQRAMLDWLEGAWRRPDNGIWEIRGVRRDFTHSKVMAWVAADRAARSVRDWHLDGPAGDWQRLADAIHADVCAKAVRDDGAFTQSYGSDELDASTLTIPLLGFLPPDDPRVVATVDAIARELDHHGFVLRYRPEAGVDGLAGGEAPFLLCSFWMADVLALMGRRAEAEHRFERLLAVRNDVGLLAEEYDPATGRQLGNFPQAFSHVALVNTAAELCPHSVGAGSERSAP